MARSRTSVTGTHLSVDGLAESIKALRQIDKALPRVVSKASRVLVKSEMVPPAVSNWRSQRIKPSQAKRAIKGSGTTTGAALKLMYASVPYAAGVEYGSHQFGQFRPWRGNKFTVAPGASTGYVVQDAIRDNLEPFGVKWEKAVADAIQAAFREQGV